MPKTGPGERIWQLGFRTHVIALALACLLPLSGLGFYSMLRLAAAERAADRAEITGAAHIIAAAVDQRLRYTLADLRALAKRLRHNTDLVDFYSDCAALADESGGWVVLADTAGDQIFNTKRPLGASLPPAATASAFREAIATGEPRISNLITGTIDPQPQFAVYMPLREGGAVTRVLAMTFPTRVLSDLLRQQRLPGDWIIGAVDRDGTLFANRRGTLPAGTMANPQVRDLPPDQDEGFFRLNNRRGVPFYMGVAHSALSGWKIVVGIPAATVDAPLRQTMLRFAALGSAILLLALAAAALIGGYLSAAMKRLAVTAHALGHREPVPAMSSTVREVTQVARALRQAEAALAASEGRLRRSQQHLALAQRVSRTGSVLHDVKSGVSEWSDELYHVLGLKRGVVPPTFESFLQLVHPEDRATIVENQEALFHGKLLPLQEYRVIRPDGSLRMIHSKAEPLFDEAGQASRILVTFLDVTKLRAAEARQRELEQQLHHAQKLEALGTLAGGVAHDLNNTLVPVLGLAKITQRRLPDGSRERANLAVILQAGERARDLVRQILAFSRKDAPTREHVDLAPLIRDSLKMVRASLPSTIQIEEAIATVPPVLGDPGQLHQILINLVVNAAQAIGDGMGRITVTLGADRHSLPDEAGGETEGPAVHLSVRDTGCGMDEATRRRIFEPFFTTKPVGEGTGLGLSVVHGIVTQHGGRIRVESHPGEGTRFDVYLPALAGAEEALHLETAALAV